MKRLGLIAAAVLLTFTLAACGSANKASEGSNEAAVKNLTIWTTWASDGDTFKAPIDKIVADWNANNPTIQLKVEATAGESYKTKIKTAAAANELPDIFFTWGAGFSKPFAESGTLLPLNEYLNDGTKDRVLAGSLENFTYDDNIYGLPFTLYVGTFFVNEELFDANGIAVPANYEELLTAVKAFREKGINPIAVGGKDLWPSMFYYDVLALREGGADLNLDALKGGTSFEDPVFVEAARKLQELANADAFADGFMGLSRDESEAVFASGQIPMYYNGSWVATALESDSSAIKGKVKAMNFPLSSGTTSSGDEWLGGVNDTFMVSSNTPHKDEAVQVLKYLTENLSNEGYQVGAGLPTWKTTEVDESKINPLLADLVKQTESATGIVPPWDIYLEGQDAEKHKNLVAQLLTNNITPEQFAKEMQAINE